MINTEKEINNRIKYPKSIIDESMNNKKENTVYKRVLSVLLFIISIIYVFIRIDFDDTIIGFIDDFFIFMSSFCYMYAQFLNEKIRATILLKFVSLIFCFLGVITLIVFLLIK